MRDGIPAEVVYLKLVEGTVGNGTRVVMLRWSSQ
jgi:hypothetical protein